MKELIKAIDELDDKKKEPLEVLQKIGKILLSKYIIKVDDVIIRPLWIEAYYYSENNFNDPFVHRNPKQKEFNVLYFHHKTDDQRNGVDICLSRGNYYFSFLLKYTLIDGMVKTQSELSPLIREKYKNMQNKDVLVYEESLTDIISYTERIGLTAKKETDNEYKNLKLSIVRDFDKMFSSNFKFPKKESLVSEYLNNTDMTKKEKANFCKKTLNYYLSDYKE